MNVESYKHNFAKNLLLRWLRQDAEAAGSDNYTNVPLAPFNAPSWMTDGIEARQPTKPLSWRVNRPGPHWGVWAEYPIGEAGGQSPVWDEVQDDCPQCRDDGSCALDAALDTREGQITWGRVHCPYVDAPPSYADYVARVGSSPTCVFDIAIQHKGSIVWAFEVVHKHTVSRAKQIAVDRLGLCHLFLISADWILSQVEKPAALRVVDVTCGRVGVA